VYCPKTIDVLPSATPEGGNPSCGLIR